MRYNVYVESYQEAFDASDLVDQLMDQKHVGQNEVKYFLTKFSPEFTDQQIPIDTGYLDDEGIRSLYYSFIVVNTEKWRSE